MTGLTASLAAIAVGMPTHAQLNVTPDEVLQTCPNLTQAQADKIANPPPLEYGESAFRAYAECVPWEEGKRRMNFQSYWDEGPQGESVRAAIAKMEAEEPTFVEWGLAFEPDHHVVVVFTQDGERTLARYITSPLVKAKTIGGPTAEEVAWGRAPFALALAEHGIETKGESVSGNRLSIWLHSDEARTVRALERAGKLDVPDWVEFETFAPLATDPLPVFPAVNPKRVKGFPKLRRDNRGVFYGGNRNAPFEAELELTHGCITAEYRDVQHTLVWPSYAALDLSDPSMIRIVQNTDSPAISVGEVVRGDLPHQFKTLTADPDAVRASVAKQATDTDVCPPPYLTVHHLRSAEAVRRESFDAEVEGIVRNAGIARQEAEERVRRQRARAEMIERLLPALLDAHGERVVSLFDASNTMQGVERVTLMALSGTEPGDVLPPELAAMATVQPVNFSSAQLEAKADALRGEFAAIGVAAEVEAPDPNSGRLFVRIDGDARRLSDGIISGQVVLPPDSYISFPEPDPLQSSAPADYAELALASLRREVARQNEPEFRQVYDLVAERMSDLGIGGGPQDMLMKTQALFDNGFTDSARLRKLEASGDGPVSALVFPLPMDFARRNAVLSDWVGVAEVTGVEWDEAPEGDGYNATLSLAQVETVYSANPDIDKAKTLSVRLRTGPDEDGRFVVASDEPLVLPGFGRSVALGERLYVHLSRGAYAASVRADRAALPDRYSFTQPAERVVGDRVQPLDLSGYDATFDGQTLDYRRLASRGGT